MDLDLRVKMNYDDLTDSEKEMVRFIINRPQEVINMNIVELGEAMLRKVRCFAWPKSWATMDFQN